MSTRVQPVLASTARFDAANVKTDAKTGPIVSRSVLNFWIDSALGVSLVFVLWLTVVMKVVFPPPSRCAGWTLWGGTFDQWHDAQFYAFCLCALLALEHVVLHWKWVCSVLSGQILRRNIRPDEANQLVSGIALFIGIMVVTLTSLIVALFSVTGPP